MRERIPPPTGDLYYGLSFRTKGPSVTVWDAVPVHYYSTKEVWSDWPIERERGLIFQLGTTQFIWNTIHHVALVEMSKPQFPIWSAKDLHAIIAKRQEVMTLAGYPLPQDLLGKNTDSASIP